MLSRSKFTWTSAAAVCAILLLAIAGAYAYWSNGGSGTDTAGSGTNSAITVTQTTSPAGLFPGGPTEPLAGAFNNSNDSQVFVHQVIATISSVAGPNIDVAHPCGPADYQINGFPVLIDAEVPSGNAVGSWDGASIQMLNAGTNQDGCKDAVVTLTYSSN